MDGRPSIVMIPQRVMLHKLEIKTAVLVPSECDYVSMEQDFFLNTINRPYMNDFEHNES